MTMGRGWIVRYGYILDFGIYKSLLWLYFPDVSLADYCFLEIFKQQNKNVSLWFLRYNSDCIN